MDKAIRTIPGVGEVGIDTQASAGNGCYYAKTYDGYFNSVGFDSVDEALEELEFAVTALTGEDYSPFVTINS